MLRGTPYQWSVNTILTDSQKSTSSDIEVFYNAGPGVQSFIPFPATAISPLDGEVLDSSVGTVTLRWEASDLDGDITEFDVYFGNENPPPIYSESLTSTSLQDIALNSSATYYWKVLTRDSQGNESNSKIFSFTIE